MSWFEIFAGFRDKNLLVSQQMRLLFKIKKKVAGLKKHCQDHKTQFTGVQNTFTDVQRILLVSLKRSVERFLTDFQVFSTNFEAH